MSRTRSKHLFETALNFIPGGVNSPVRAFNAVGGNPLFIARAEGPYLIDVDGNKYIELINSWGPMILGHDHPKIRKAVLQSVPNSLSFGAPNPNEVEIARLIIEMVPSIEKVRMVNSGTEATMSAIRLARGFTNRNKIIKFEGCYHGHGDSFLIAAGSGAITMGTPDSPGVTPGTAADTLLAPFNDVQAVESLMDHHKSEIAAIILEPVAGNMGCVLPKNGFLDGLRSICDREGVILIFDEVMTGFRLAPGGAQEIFGVYPDLTTLGKIIGGGMPVGAYGGRKDIMDFVSPLGPVYQAGTLSGNPVAMAAGVEMLTYLNENPETYSELQKTTQSLVKGIRENLEKTGSPFCVNSIGSMFTLFFTEGPVENFEDAKKSDLQLFAQYFQKMLQSGAYLAPSQFESLFISTAIEAGHVETILAANLDSLQSLIG